jgi:hypothetical protein
MVPETVAPVVGAVTVDSGGVVLPVAIRKFAGPYELPELLTGM